MFGDVSGGLRVTCLHHILIRLSSGSRANLDSLVNMTLVQSDTVQLPCSRHHFNRAPLYGTDRETQTRGTQAYSPFICNIWRTVAADIALPMDAVTIDVTRVEVALRFRLATIAIYRSSAEVVTIGRPPTGLRTTVCVVWNCFYKREITK
ncbi:uncharacterized protein TNCV_387071 [Trichonephila clavipes]|nr:uncharacterized protein TNCV_387071 [Trichonephila clavipes]